MKTKEKPKQKETPQKVHTPEPPQKKYPVGKPEIEKEEKKK